MFRTTLALSFLILLLAIGTSFAQSDFSAEIVDLNATGTPTLGKIYFTKDQKRIDMQDASGDDSIILSLFQPTASRRGTHLQIGGRGDTIIMNFSTHTSTVLFPQENKYAQEPVSKLSPAELYSLYAFVEPRDVDNACPEWMARTNAQGETCRNLGEETVNGRSTVKYELSCYREVCRLWVDRNLHALVKRETAWNSTELRNIVEGPQQANLFEIPAGYTAKKIGGIIRPTYPQ